MVNKMRADVFERGIVLYGAGSCAVRFLECLRECGVNIVSIIDSDPQKVGTILCEHIVEGKEALQKYCDNYICITVERWDIYEEIENELMGRWVVSKDRIILRNALLFLAICNDIEANVLIGKKDISVFENTNDIPLYFGVIDGLVLGGVEERVKLLCSNMLKEGREKTYILTDDGDYENIDDTIKNNIQKVKIAEGKTANNVKNLIETISRLRPCIIVTNQPDELLIAASIVKYYCPSEMAIISIISGGIKNIYDEYVRFPFRSDLYIGVSEDIKKYFIEQGISNTISMKVPFPCDEKIVRGYSLDRDTPMKIGYAGRLDGFEHSQKRMDVLINVINEIHTRNIPYSFEIAGDGEAKPKMLEIMNNMGIMDNVKFVGRIPKKEIMDFWKKQDIGLNVADYEGRSISIAEIMGGGAVPIVTNTSGVNEDISDSKNGFIVPLGDYKSIADRIQYLDEHREDLEIMGMNAHDDIWPVSRMDKHLAFWKEILDGIKSSFGMN